MQKNSQDFSLEAALRLAQDPAAGQLLAVLQRKDSQTLHKAMEEAAAGAYTQAGATLQTLLDAPEVRSLLQELGR